jgi:hypothetical protein
MVVVPEQDFRSEKCAGDRISLPLTQKDRVRLVLFISKGGNMQPSGIAMPLSEVEKTYGKLLDWLGQEHPFSAVDGPELNRLIPGIVISDITDAREKGKPDVKGDVLAKSDGRFYWIFYPAKGPDGYGPIANLLVTQIAATVPQ